MTRAVPPHQDGGRSPGVQPPTSGDVPQWPVPPDPWAYPPQPGGPPPTGWSGTPQAPVGPPPGWYGPPPGAWGPPPDGPLGPGVGAPAGPVLPPVRPIANRRRRRRGPWLAAAVVIALVVSVGTYANVGGMRSRLESLVHRIDLAFNPPVDRATVPTIEVTPPPGEVDDEDIVAVLPDPSEEVELLVETEAPTATPVRATSRPTAASTDGPVPTTVPTPAPTPRPVRKPVRFRLKVADPDTRFISQVDNTMCAAAGIQMVLAMHDQVGHDQGRSRPHRLPARGVGDPRGRQGRRLGTLHPWSRRSRPTASRATRCGPTRTATRRSGRRPRRWSAPGPRPSSSPGVVPTPGS